VHDPNSSKTPVLTTCAVAAVDTYYPASVHAAAIMGSRHVAMPITRRIFPSSLLSITGRYITFLMAVSLSLLDISIYDYYIVGDEVPPSSFVEAVQLE